MKMRYRIKVSDGSSFSYIEDIGESDNKINIVVVSTKIDNAKLFTKKETSEWLKKFKNNEMFKEYIFSLELAVDLNLVDNAECCEKVYGTMKCKVCEIEFELKKENKYIADVASPFLPDKKQEAFDCPYCGCQNLAGLYYEPVPINNRKIQNNEK